MIGTQIKTSVKFLQLLRNEGIVIGEHKRNRDKHGHEDDGKLNLVRRRRSAKEKRGRLM